MDDCEDMVRDKVKIESLISEIRKDTVRLPPAQLLQYAAHISFLPSRVGETDAIALRTAEDGVRYVEYLQSVIVTTAPAYEEMSQEQFEAKAQQLFGKVECLQRMVDRFIISWAMSGFDTGKTPSSEVPYVLESQLDYHVRGNRYMCFQRRYYELLLFPMNDLFMSVFGCTADDLVEGFMTLDAAVSMGMFASIQRLCELVTQEHPMNSVSDIARFVSEQDRDAIADSLSIRNYDVKHRTNWPDRLIDLMTYDPGEATWPTSGEYPFWPCSELPVRSRPFVRLNGRAYCFDHYTLEDNFFRMLQDALKRGIGDVTEKINISQQKSSEGAVAKVFERLLPGCEWYVNNYYGPKKHRAESDLIVVYRDVLIAVEIKAGRANHTMPLMDWEGHKRAYKSILEKADHQCDSVLSYIRESKGCAKFSNSDNTPKAEIDTSRLTDLFALSVSVDNINTFAARAEKLCFLEMNTDTISLCLDDLLVYEDYFDSPLVFMHFLKQRRRAMSKTQLCLTDELDHLGLYITHNNYSLCADDYPKDATVIWDECRVGLDRYYEMKSAGAKVAKPTQNTPPLLIDIVRRLESPYCRKPVEVSSRLLDLPQDTRTKLCAEIAEAERRGRTSRGEMTVLGVNGPEPFDVFVVSNSAHRVFTMDERRRRVMSSMVTNGEQSRMLLVLFFDESARLAEVSADVLERSDIPDEEIASLAREGSERNNAIVRQEMRMRRIGRNELCPCGSGKKYKRCHGSPHQRQ